MNSTNSPRTYRLAYMKVSTQLMESLLPPGKILDCISDKIGPVDYSWLEKKLDLPSNAKINLVSMSAFFMQGCVGIRIECSDFREIPEASTVPEVEAIYHGNVGLKFCRWQKDAALNGDYKPSCKTCSEILRLIKVPDDKYQSVAIRFREFL